MQKMKLEKRGEKKKKGNKNRKRKKTVAIRTEKFFLLLHSRPNQKVGVVTRITLCFTLHYCYA